MKLINFHLIIYNKIIIYNNIYNKKNKIIYNIVFII